MKKNADLIFKEESQLIIIDAYKGTISDKEVLAWHIYNAYDGAPVPNLPFHHHDSCCIKFFIYLTVVGPKNGCTSYMSGSHKITHALRKGLYGKKIIYTPHWKSNDLIKFVKLKKNISYFKKYFYGTKILDQFLEDVKKNTNNYDFRMLPGDAILFDEDGKHRGSKH
jgi:hypothetical protein